MLEIRLHAAVPPKPTFGAPCNGCGVCCAAEPCPVSRFLLGHRQGSCPALVWHGEDRRYYCGVVRAPAVQWPWLTRLPLAWQAWIGRALARRIAAGSGCDADYEVE